MEGKAILEDGSPATILPATATLEPWADAAAATPFTDDRTAQLWLNQYALRPEPQHLAALLRKSAAWAAHPYIRAGFPAYALAAAPAAAPTFAAGLRDADEPTRAMGVVALRWAGLDARALAATLGPEWTTRAEALSIRPDPLALEATAARLDETTARMDLAWAWFMATGRPEPIRAIVDLLRYRDDYSALRTAQATPGRKEAADPLARGVLYATAGWSLASFYATHVLAEDYVRLWREDGSVPAPIREELRTLLSNEAFRPPKQG
ncbi:hypothetical protein [Anaeromyxobacter oryzae]|uniref:hypothetical protein n=1 Tax=Anaeromyxobacter oryzae TaxID=2918170 RepID=UPI0020BFC288|nr:hypothetical protein [Anaeromyxobacter oryzae]